MLLVVIFVAQLEGVLVKLQLLGKDNVVFHQVYERGVTIPSFSHAEVQVEGFQIGETTYENVVEVPVNMGVVRLIFIQMHVPSNFVELS